MAVNVDDPTLPAACATPTAPTLSALGCEPELNYGPISNLYMGPDDPDAAFTAPVTKLEIDRRLALTDDDPEALRIFIGTMTFGTAPTETEEFNGKNYPKPAVRNYPVSTKNTSADYYEFARTTQKGGRSVRVWGVSQDSKYFYGGLNGIQGVLSLNNILPEDFAAAQTITGNLSVKGFFDPKRVASPVTAV